MMYDYFDIILNGLFNEMSAPAGQHAAPDLRIRPPLRLHKYYYRAINGALRFRIH